MFKTELDYQTQIMVLLDGVYRTDTKRGKVIGDELSGWW
jgi:hypothetical protein